MRETTHPTIRLPLRTVVCLTLSVGFGFDARIAREVRFAGHGVLADAGADGVGEAARATHFDVGAVAGVVAGMELFPVETHIGVDCSMFEELLME